MSNNLKEIRKIRGLTQEELAGRIGTNAGQIHKLESGMRRLSDRWIAPLTEALNCTIAELFGEVQARNVPVIGDVPGGDLAEALQQPPEQFIPFSSRRPNVYALRVRGNSMNRIAPDGAYIIVDFGDNDPARLHNHPVVACVESGGRTECSFKIYKRNPDRFEPFSTEPGYDTIFPDGRPWRIYGRVIGMVGYLDGGAQFIEYQEAA